MSNKKFLFIFFYSFFAVSLYAQVTPVEIKKSDVKQIIDGQKFIVHIVEKGQTLFSISRAYGIKYQEATIKKDIDHLKIGDTVWIPVKEETPPADVYFNYYEVRQGETLYGLTKRYGISESDLKALNPELDTDILKAKQIIKIPRVKDKPKEDDTVDLKINTEKETKDSADNTPSEKWEGKIKIRPRKSKQDIHVVLMMPFYLEQAEQVSVSKFDIDQRKKKSYQSFEFIQFYEGILAGLKKLEKKGIGVVLYVYDVEQNDSEKVVELFKKEEVQSCDFMITLLYQSAFSTAAKLARENNIFIINPLSKRSDIIENNPYTIKYLPSEESYASKVVSILKKNYPGAEVILIHSGKAEEKSCLDKFAAELSGQKEFSYSVTRWDSKLELSKQLSDYKKNIIISLYDQNKQNNVVYASLLLNKLGTVKKNPPILFGPAEWLDYANIDYNYLERLNFHYADNLSLDPLDYLHQRFINEFISEYSIEPNSQFASVGHDIIIHFVTGLQQKNDKFWESPNIISPDILHQASYRRPKASSGFENNKIFFYRIENFQPVPVN